MLNAIRQQATKRTRNRGRREENGNPLSNISPAVPQGQVERDAREQARFRETQKYTHADWGGRVVGVS